MNSAAEWVAQIPERITPRAALALVETGLADAKQATDEIVARYSSGTLPPPPWPQHPELVKVIEALQGGKVLLGKLVTIGRGDESYPANHPQAIALRNGGQRLYAEIATMQKNMEGVKVEDVPRLVAEAAKRAASMTIGGPLAIALVLWLLKDEW